MNKLVGYHLIVEHWNTKGIIPVRKVSEDLRNKIVGTLKTYTVREIKQATDTYDKILKGKEYYWTYKWTLYDFLNRGLDRFLDANPDDYLKRDNKKEGSNDSTPKFDNPDWL